MTTTTEAPTMTTTERNEARAAREVLRIGGMLATLDGVRAPVAIIPDCSDADPSEVVAGMLQVCRGGRGGHATRGPSAVVRIARPWSDAEAGQPPHEWRGIAVEEYHDGAFVERDEYDADADGVTAVVEHVRRILDGTTRHAHDDHDDADDTEECAYCGASGARMGDPTADPYDPCVGEPICDKCRGSLHLDDADDD